MTQQRCTNLAVDGQPGVISAAVLLHLLHGDAAPWRRPFQPWGMWFAGMIETMARVFHWSIAEADAQPDISTEQGSHLPSLGAGATAASTPSGYSPSPAAPAYDVNFQTNAPLMTGMSETHHA